MFFVLDIFKYKCSETGPVFVTTYEDPYSKWAPHFRASPSHWATK